MTDVLSIYPGPVLLELFLHMGLVEATAVPLAIGTAQASILIASLTAAWAHWRRATIDRPLVIAWVPALIAGTMAGLVLGAWLSARCPRALCRAAGRALVDRGAGADAAHIVRALPRRHRTASAPAIVNLGLGKELRFVVILMFVGPAFWGPIRLKMPSGWGRHVE